MPLVRVKAKYQVTLPTKVREKMGVEVGDLLEAKVEGNTITFTPKSLTATWLRVSTTSRKVGSMVPCYQQD